MESGATVVTVAATDRPVRTLRVVTPGADRPARPARNTGRVRRARSGPDRLTVVLVSLTLFLGLLALLADQLRAASPSHKSTPVVVVRRVYVTRVVTTVPGVGSGTSVSQSVSSSGSAYSAASAPTTSTSG